MLLCELFGHKAPGDRRYGAVHPGTVDGIDRCHCSVKAACSRCGKVYTVVNIVLPAKLVKEHVERMQKIGHPIKWNP